MNWYRRAALLNLDQMADISRIVQKIILGRTDWTDAELQLHQNHPDLIELMLRKEQEKSLNKKAVFSPL